MPTIFLIRHGESESNSGKTTSSFKDIELSPRGLQQAEDVASEFREANIFPDLVVISPYLRARQTAAPTLKIFSSIPIEEGWLVHEFDYLSAWSKENSTSEDRRQYVEAYWELSDPSYIDSPGSESFEQFIRRAREVMIRLKKTRHNAIAIFSHEQFICALLWLSQQDSRQICLEAMRDYKSFLMSNPVPNGAFVRVQFQGKRDRWHYEMITSHLNKPDLVFSNGLV